MSVYTFPCNPFQANTYLFVDETGACALIDATFHSPGEWSRIEQFINDNGWELTCLLITHYHFDHVIGVSRFREGSSVPVLAHRGGGLFIDQVGTQAAMFGVSAQGDFSPSGWLADGDEIAVGGSVLKAIYTPGHADGSVCFYNEPEALLFSGDVLFHESIGRTDLPTGDFQTLSQSVNDRLFLLPDATRVYPGHGQPTSIGHEKRFNPFL